MTPSMIFDQETCSKCGMCAVICGTKSINWTKGEYPTRNTLRADTCLVCGQCMAVCPTSSITIAGLTNSDLLDLPKETPDFASFYNLLLTRRSVRHFKKEPIPRELIEKIIEAAVQAPMGFPPHKTHITVVQNRESIARMLPLMIKFYEDLLGWMKNPIIRYKIKKDSRPEDFHSIQNHLIPLLQQRLPEMKKSGSDEITWGAPALLLFHAHQQAESYSIDACIALTYSFLAAHALGLGVTVSGLLPPAINKLPELRNMLKIPEEHEVVCAMLLGYPRYHFRSGIKRPLASVNWV